MPASNVIVLGSINVDLVVKSTKLPRPGETVIGGEFYRAAGGKGANQAVAAARIDDAPVAFIAAVGDDSFGQESLAQLRRENMNCDTIRGIVGEPTGVAAILVDENGENCISVASGANALLCPDDVLSVGENTFRDARVFLACLESPLETVVAGLRRARSAGLLTILNPAPALAEVATREILELVDVITPNESEAQALTGIPISTVDDGLLAARKLQSAGCERVVLTRGARGVLTVDGEQTTELPAFPVDAVDATAAGDAFNGALAVALAHETLLPEACRRASAAAAISVTRRGAQPSLPTRAEIDAFLSE